MAPRRRLGLLLAAGLLPLPLLLSSPASAAEVVQPGYTNDPALTPARTFGGVWRLGAYEPRLTPVWGGDPPLTAAGRRAWRQNAAKRKTEGGKDRCLPFGTPRQYLSPWPIMFLQTARLTTIVHEENRVMRAIRFAAQHQDPNIWDPSFGGDPMARWDGDVLVVDTNNFNGETWLDDMGLPASDQLHVVERWRKLEGGDRLEVVFTIEDPVNYTQAWTARKVFEARPGLQLDENWVCGGPHRSLEGVNNADAVYVKPVEEVVTK